MNAGQGLGSPFPGRDLFRSIWSASERESASDDPPPPRAAHLPFGWLLGGAALVLVLVVGLLAYMSIKRSESAMSRLLAEKGSSLLMVFESALRTSMRGPAGLRLQSLLAEMSRGPDIEFVAVTMPDGVIIAHSNENRIGEMLDWEGDAVTLERLAELDPDDNEKWRIVHSEGKRVFLLYRHFTLGQKDWTKDVPEPTIFLGMNVSPFEITNSQNRNYVTMLSIVTMLVGLSCLLALCFAQKAAESRKSQKMAEREVLRLEKEMRRQEKLAAVGTLAAGVAHEIRNPLSSIKGYATYFREKFPEGSEDREAATVMVNEVSRLNRVITDLLGLSRPGDVNMKPVCVENMVKHVLRLIRQNAMERNVILACRFAPHVPKVLADMERLSQALLNLCLNAIDAMPNGGKLTIAVASGRCNVCIIARDTGQGIPPEIIDKIFDPYFTTKGSGTGLGLPMVDKIIRAHKGKIDVVSHLERRENGVIIEHGETIFRIWLPIAQRGDAGDM